MLRGLNFRKIGRYSGLWEEPLYNFRTEKGKVEMSYASEPKPQGMCTKDLIECLEHGITLSQASNLLKGQL